jgi:hypothetical protein
MRDSLEVPNPDTGGAMAERIVTLASASRATGLAYHTLRRLVHSRRIKSVRVDGIARCRLSDVFAVIEELDRA